nr:hypothetical protein CFP56_32385 [Quercus suber]
MRSARYVCTHPLLDYALDRGAFAEDIATTVPSPGRKMLKLSTCLQAFLDLSNDQLIADAPCSSAAID